MSYLNENTETIANNVFLTLLWILFLTPLYLGFSNAFAKDTPEEVQQEVPVMEEVKEIIIPGDIRKIMMGLQVH